MNKIQSLLTIFLLCLVSSLAQAEQKKTFGQWDVHYMAVNSTFLTPQVASTYGIQRSRYKAFVTISVLDNKGVNNPPVKVDINGSVKDLLGRQQELDFQQIEEGEAIYYISEFDIQNDELLKFNIVLGNSEDKHTLAFTQKFYVD